MKQAIEKTKNSKTKTWLQEYYTKLEDIKATLVPTERRSIFAAVKRLREDISDVYTSICSQEAAPGNLQLERVNVLANKVKSAELEIKAIVNKYAPKSEILIQKEGLHPEAKKPEEKKAF